MKSSKNKIRKETKPTRKREPTRLVSLKFRKPTAKERKEIIVRYKEMKSGAVKGIEVHPE